jgi:hypothetical protein
MAETCTWKGCDAPATQPLKDRNGAEWAILCSDHHQEFDDAIGSMQPKRCMRAWALAGHGHPRREKVRSEIASAGAKLYRTLTRGRR